MRIFLLFLIISLYGEPGHGSQNGFKDWGIGIISRSDGRNQAKTINFPRAKINLYKSPNGKKIGHIKPVENKISDTERYHTYSMKLNARTFGFNSFALELKEINHEGGCLKYYKKRNGFVKVFSNIYRPGTWIKISDLEKHAYKTQDWKDFLLSRKPDNILGYYPNVPVGLNLRKTPDTKYKPIILMKGRSFEITLTGRHRGLWCEAKVVLYERSPCGGDEKILGKWNGWLKALDDSGYPNIWFFTRGC